MATCGAVINSALRKLGKLSAGREARSTDAQDALESLRSMYRSWIDSGAFGRLRDVVPTADYTAGENERVFRQTDAVTSIDLPALVSDVLPGPWQYGERWVPNPTENRNERPPRDTSVVVISDAFTGETQEYLYDGTQKLWQSIGGLGLTDQAPLSRRDHDGLAASLAVRIADEYGDVPAATVRLANLFQSNLVHRWGQPRTPVYGSYF